MWLCQHLWFIYANVMLWQVWSKMTVCGTLQVEMAKGIWRKHDYVTDRNDVILGPNQIYIAYISLFGSGVTICFWEIRSWKLSFLRTAVAVVLFHRRKGNTGHKGLFEVHSNLLATVMELIFMHQSAIADLDSWKKKKIKVMILVHLVCLRVFSACEVKSERIGWLFLFCFGTC